MKRRSVAALTLLAGTVTVILFKWPASANTPSAVANYSHGILHVRIPYQARQSGDGQLNIDVLDAEDKVVGHAEQRVTTTAEKSVLQADIKLAQAIPMEDLVWHRLRYQVGNGFRNIESISEILRAPILHIVGQQAYLAGGQAAVRVVVTDSKNEAAPGPSALRIELLRDKSVQPLFAGALNKRGTAEAQFRLPANLTGAYKLRYVADTPIGSTEFIQPVRIEDKVSILLTTEKPLYQPGQTIHARALALDRANHQAAANRRLTFEVEDSRANKVFKQAAQTDSFGIASAEFPLADEVNLGTYHLRALMEQPESGNRAELALNVERYVLPKFKVEVDLTGDGKRKHGYRPGDRVRGTIRANYFFGKALDGAEVSVKTSGMDVAMFEAGSAQGRTDRDGVYRFELKLPAYLAGRPLSQGAARVLLEATVKDTAGHSETRGEPITVSDSPLLITAIPEGGTLVPGLQNQVFVVTSYADGTPAAATLRVHAPASVDQSVATDAGGVALIRVNVGENPVTLQVDAADKEGNRATKSLNLPIRSSSDQILLRTERAVFSAGDRIQIKVLSTRQRGTVYIDAVKEGQTVLTRDLDLVSGQAELTVPATPDMAGTLDFNAYQFGADARPIGDHRLVFVQPADELKIEAAADAPSYRPGADAIIHFRVTNNRGEGVLAALGLQVVDEAVFALAQKQPGFAKVFFFLEQEAMKPRYEIHSIGMPDVAAQHDRAAQALFAATEMVHTNHFETEQGRNVTVAKNAAYMSRYQGRFLTQLRQTKGDLNIRDAWGTAVKVERHAWHSGYYAVRSAGPDKRFETMDDLTATVEIRTKRVISGGAPSYIGVDIEHDRGPMNGLAEITGSVVDPTGTSIPGAGVKVVEFATKKARTALTNASGQFSFAGLAPGRYRIEMGSPGFQTASREATLEARDRAVVSVTLTVGAVTETIVVEELARFSRTDGVGLRPGFGGGGGFGGVIGGVAGGMPQAIMMMFGGSAPRYVPQGVATIIRDEPAPHIRSYFPEALYINPKIITDRNGRATIAIPLADSITTWRMAMFASTTQGALGSGQSSIKAFQDFFVDLDLPVTLTQGDRVSVPVGIYNYSAGRGDVNLQLQKDDWFTLAEDVADKTVTVNSGQAGGSQFTVQANRIGKFKVTLAARMNNRSDMIVREIEVVPNGREQSQVFNGRLEAAVQHELKFPPNSIPGAGTLFVRLYPGPLSQVIEGMDGILRMPFGCFEQTSSATYPNVLALDYMKRTKKVTPEVHAKAEGFIANGYQRLLTFEVPGGGFSWFGHAPANKILTAYGLMEFSDMSKVHDVDPRLIERTQAWLAGQQQPDGSWKPDNDFINEGATNRYNSDVLRITAYLGWALETTGYRGPAVERARQFAENHLAGKIDTYTKAVLANFAVDGSDRNFTSRAMQMLLEDRTEKDEQVWWTAEETAVFAAGPSAAVETTGLASQALLKWGQASPTASKALSYLASKKDARGTWGTTQATIMALRALLLSMEKGSADARGTVEVTLNGKPVEKLVLTSANNDLLHQFVFKGVDAKASHTVGVRFDGKGGLAYQVVGRYFVPWTEKPAADPLTIGVAYDRTRLAQDDIATATATIKSNLNKIANMVMVDLGIPPGFDLLSEDLQSMQEKTAGQKSGRLEKFTLTATQAILYFDSIAPGNTVTVRFRLRAKYPIRAKTFQSRVYEYYDPAVSSVATPVQLEVRR